MTPNVSPELIASTFATSPESSRFNVADEQIEKPHSVQTVSRQSATPSSHVLSYSDLLNQGLNPSPAAGHTNNLIQDTVPDSQSDVAVVKVRKVKTRRLN